MTESDFTAFKPHEPPRRMGVDTTPMMQGKNEFMFTDHRGDVWKLKPTGDPSMPLTIEIDTRFNSALEHEQEI